ncbi:unnamed protein product [Caretta caretta]
MVMLQKLGKAAHTLEPSGFLHSKIRTLVNGFKVATHGIPSAQSLCLLSGPLKYQKLSKHKDEFLRVKLGSSIHQTYDSVAQSTSGNLSSN